MKTKIRTLIAIVAMGILGLANINATANNKSNEVSEADESLTIETWMLENENWNTKTETCLVDSEQNLVVEAWMIENENFLNQYLQEQKLEIEPWMTDEALFNSAKSYTASRVAWKNEKYAHRQMFQRHARNKVATHNHEMIHCTY